MFSFLRRFGTPQIDVDELDALLQEGSLLVLDVREDSEFKSGHLRGAIHVSVKKLPDRVSRLKRDRRYAVICQSGSRSRRATDYLIEQGFEGTVSVRGGTGAWARSGRAARSLIGGRGPVRGARPRDPPRAPAPSDAGR